MKRGVVILLCIVLFISSCQDLQISSKWGPKDKSVLRDEDCDYYLTQDDIDGSEYILNSAGKTCLNGDIYINGPFYVMSPSSDEEIILNCNGNKILGDGQIGIYSWSGPGFPNIGEGEITIENCTVRNKDKGFYLNSIGTTLINNLAEQNLYGFYLSEDYNSILINNEANNNSKSGFYAEINDFSSVRNTTLINNRAFYNNEAGFMFYPSVGEYLDINITDSIAAFNGFNGFFIGESFSIQNSEAFNNSGAGFVLNCNGSIVDSESNYNKNLESGFSGEGFFLWWTNSCGEVNSSLGQNIRGNNLKAIGNEFSGIHAEIYSEDMEGISLQEGGKFCYNGGGNPSEDILVNGAIELSGEFQITNPTSIEEFANESGADLTIIPPFEFVRCTPGLPSVIRPVNFN